MQRFLILLMMVLGLMVCPVMAQDEDSSDDSAAKEEAPSKEAAAELREARKEAAAYVKDELKRNKKLTSLLKKVKDNKSAKKHVEKILELTGKGKKKQTALGTVAPAQRPVGPAMDAERKKNYRMLKKSYTELSEQIEALYALDADVDCKELGDIMNAVEELSEIAKTEFGEE